MQLDRRCIGAFAPDSRFLTAPAYARRREAVFRWNGEDFKSREEAAVAKERELSRLSVAKFGDELRG